MTKKISCLCITHKRVDFLKRSIQCFIDQSYENKEMLIFYTKDDNSTRQFSENEKYNRVKLNSQKIPEGYNLMSKIRTASISELVSGEPVYIQFMDENYVAVKNGKVEKTSKVEDATDFVLAREGNKVSFHAKESYLLFNSNGELSLSENSSSFWMNRTLSDTVEFFDSEHKFKKNNDPLSSWKKETLFSQSKLPIFFIEIDSIHDLKLGYKRNLSVQYSKSDYICIWDDDDIYHTDRLYNQMNFLEFTQRPACTLSSLTILDEDTGKKYISIERASGWEGTLLCKRENMGYFACLNKQEDTPALDYLARTNNLSVMEQPELYNYCIHTGNVSGKAHFERLLKYAEEIN